MKDLNFYSYPNEIHSIFEKLIVNKNIEEHYNHCSNKQIDSNLFNISEPIPQFINDLNLYTSCINKEIIIGLVFDNDDNPYDYKEIFKELLNEMLNNGNEYSFDNEIDIDNLLISMFIDIRRFGDEVIEKPQEIEYYYQKDTFFKVFLFGIDEVGKTSLVRRLKTGRFNDNYFTPTRRFNIEYFPVEEKGLLAFWDMPGQIAFRSKWLTGVHDSNIIIYMIDVSNQRRFEESKNELWNVLNKEELSEIPLLILGNKSDLVKYSVENNDDQLQILKKEISDFYNFNKLTQINWNFLFTSVKTNFNIDKIIPVIFDLLSI